MGSAGTRNAALEKSDMLTNESNSKCTTKITKVEGEIMHNRLT
jgi:hypothetical protein